MPAEVAVNRLVAGSNPARGAIFPRTITSRFLLGLPRGYGACLHPAQRPTCKSPHEWGFTVFCFFPSPQSPSWKYLVGTDARVMTAGAEPLGLVPKIGAKSGEVCAPREREVPHGTLIKMYDYKAPRSNICGELFKKLEEYLLRPMLPLRISSSMTTSVFPICGLAI